MEKSVSYNWQIQDLNNFLGMFGIWVETRESFAVGDLLNIYAYGTGKNIGMAEIRKDKIFFNSETALGLLRGSYETGVCSQNEKFQQKCWQGRVDYRLIKRDGGFYQGETLINNSMQNKEQYSVCEHLLNYILAGENKMVISFNKDGKDFELRINVNGNSEIIIINPYDLEGYLLHDIAKKANGKDYRDYTALVSNGQKDEGFIALRTIRNFGQQIAESKRHHHCIDTEDRIKQMSEVVNAIDPEMAKEISLMRDFLKDGNVSLFDGMLETSLVAYSSEAIKMLFGLDIDPNRDINGLLKQ